MKILLVRGSFLNNFEGQNYKYLAEKHDFTAISSLFPLQSKFPFPVKKFFSPFDVGTYLSIIHPFLAKVVNFLNNRLWGDGQFLVGFDKFVRDTGPYDLSIGAETYYGYDLQIARLKREGFIKKFASVCWEIIPHNNETVSKKKRIKDEVINSIDAFICPTNMAKNALIKEGIDSNKIKIIRVGVDQSKFKPRKGSDDNSITVLFVGRLVEEKGVRNLPILFNKIVEKYKGNRPIIFRVVGDGSLKNWLIDETNNLDVVIESVAYDQMPEVYRHASVLVMPSMTTDTWAEQYGMVIVEAQSCGVPVVAYNSGAIKEVVGDGGIVVKESDTDKFADAIISILSDELTRIKISDKALNQSKKLYDANIISNNLENLLCNY